MITAADACCFFHSSSTQPASNRRPRMLSPIRIALPIRLPALARPRPPEAALVCIYSHAKDTDLIARREAIPCGKQHLTLRLGKHEVGLESGRFHKSRCKQPVCLMRAKQTALSQSHHRQERTCLVLSVMMYLVLNFALKLYSLTAIDMLFIVNASLSNLAGAICSGRSDRCSGRKQKA
jgi:hypothetical protein